MLQLFFVILIEINFKHLNQFFAASLQDVTARTSNTAQSRRGFLGKTRSPRRSFHNFHLQRNQAVLLIRRKLNQYNRIEIIHGIEQIYFINLPTCLCLSFFNLRQGSKHQKLGWYWLNRIHTSPTN